MPHKVPNDILIPEMERLLRAGKQVVFTPDGVSMRPFIEGGKDSVVLEHPADIRTGDILLCRVGTSYVLHRLIALSGDSLTLMGDGNIAGVEHCGRQDVLGRVVEIRSPRGRTKTMRGWRLWLRLLPIRPFLLKIYRHLK
jgi:hypothetical protein